MALSMKRDGYKHVPWFSIEEWHQVYQKVYSNDLKEQKEAHEILLCWKARVPELPAGTECTLLLLQVCLRDREWSSKMRDGQLPSFYEEDLRLMYATSIMRFINHITHVGYTKQSTLYEIAKQLNIPEWIVNIRHEAAHGKDLPSLSALRIATNFLLTWLHDEHWIPEAKAITSAGEVMNSQDDAIISEEIYELLELWVTIGMYIRADYTRVEALPDADLKKMLVNLRNYKLNSALNEETVPTKKRRQESKVYELKAARTFVMEELSKALLTKLNPKVEEQLMDNLINSEVLLPKKSTLSIFTQEEIDDSTSLPLDIIDFWQDLISLLEKRQLLTVFVLRLVEFCKNHRISNERRKLGSLWLNTLALSLKKQRKATKVKRMMVQLLESESCEESNRSLNDKVQAEVNLSENYDSFHLKLPCDVIHDISLIENLALTLNEFTAKFISSIIDLSSMEKAKAKRLQETIKIYTSDSLTASKNAVKLHTIEDLKKREAKFMSKESKTDEHKDSVNLFFCKEAVNNWKTATDDCDWSNSPVGILPWQTETLRILETFKNQLATLKSKEDDSGAIVPGVIDSRDLKMKAEIDWTTVLRKGRKTNRKRDKRESDILVQRAINKVQEVN